MEPQKIHLYFCDDVDISDPMTKTKVCFERILTNSREYGVFSQKKKNKEPKCDISTTVHCLLVNNPGPPFKSQDSWSETTSLIPVNINHDLLFIGV